MKRTFLILIFAFIAMRVWFNAAQAETGTQSLLFFYSPDCTQCDYVIERIIPEIKSRYGDTVSIVQYNIEEMDSYVYFTSLEDAYGAAGNDFPAFFINGAFLSGKSDIQNHIFTLIDSALAADTVHALSENDNTTDKIGTVAKQLSLAAIVSGGLLDGINPCVFTVVLFFISYLAYLKTDRQNILISGLFFIGGCFTAYYLLGLGLYEFLGILSYMKTIRRVITVVIIGSVGLLSILNFRDAYLVYRGRKMRLKLDTSQIQKMHGIIKKFSVQKYAVPLSFVIGALVSLIEFPCTGQIYVPIILLIQNNMKSGYWYLLLYNIFFILPLAGVFCVIYAGLDISKLYAKNVFAVKLLLGLFFLVFLLLYLALQ
ncbi:MAG: hypothetical protein C4541_02870 [Candidatus Auribacter fodinae]|jgi:cytochrome c biogenesis protein CcdA|uniref:Cytochrome C biogenesis protein transmembrane domain-containing protein n=1 Tax=Candidatus Auribacter fodinae TaxID=2093366 RepID=A0A3A4R4J7_9BACT|nr:MAG: hypothetical protein C4541_02870 [Candidatus Auribacter fodinae]